MPRRSNQQADLSALTDNNPVYDLDNVYLSDRGWAYRHYTSADKLEFWDEVLVAGEVPSADTPDTFGTASPTFLTGDGAQMPIDRVYLVALLTGGTSLYTTATGVATSGSATGSGLTVDITADAGVVTDVVIADQGDGLYEDGDVLTIAGGDGTATFEIAIL